MEANQSDSHKALTLAATSATFADLGSSMGMSTPSTVFTLSENISTASVILFRSCGSTLVLAVCAALVL